MLPKTGLPKRKALRNNPVFECGLKDNRTNQDIAHPNMRGQLYNNGSSVMSMFCGCGGLDLGFLGGFRYLGDEYEALPFNIIKAVDSDEKAIQTYNLNISEHGEVGDLTVIDPCELPKARILIGGFPCQDFSSSGPKVGFAGERGQLYLSMIAYMRMHKPDIVVGENVPHLAALHGGKYLNRILEDIKAVGYNTIVWELFAPLYGLSQSRRRLIIVAVREELGFPPDAPEPKLLSGYLPIEHAIGDLEDISDESVTNQSQYFVATRATSGGGQGDHTNKRGQLAYCIRANAKARIQFHYSLDRRLTVRECARLQSFPDEFVFPFAAMSNMTQIGNAVPPILGHAIAAAIANYIEMLDRGEKILDNKNADSSFEQISLFKETQQAGRLMDKKDDSKYLGILLNPLDECAGHKPAFGGNDRNGVDIAQFREMYGGDPLYHWVGLDSDLMYAAHKAAGGMTSIYRQLGIGCERLLRQIIQDEFQLDDTQTAWSYTYDKGNGTLAKHTLDACIRTNDIRERTKRERFSTWLVDTARGMDYSESNINALNGAVFEIRQGYKSADSKRQNADLRFGMRARSDDALLPVIVIVSTQVNNNVFHRYRDQRLHMMLGLLKGGNSTFEFFSDVIGYDLAGFFKRNSADIRKRLEAIIKKLLTP